MATHEHTINVALGEVLQALRPHSWTIHAEETRTLRDSARRPDILIEEASQWPVVIEADRENHDGAESDANGRLGQVVTETGRPIESALALVYPLEVRDLSGAALRAGLNDTEALNYALLTQTTGGHIERLPQSGWLRGSAKDLAMLAHRASTPPPRIERLGRILEEGVQDAAASFTHLHPSHADDAHGAAMARILAQADDQAGQTRRMAMIVLANALLFHSALAAAHFRVHDGGTWRPVRPLAEFRLDRELYQLVDLSDEWCAILRVNYWPIFATATQLLRVIPILAQARILEALWRATQSLIQDGVTQSHDLTGVIFQRLIADRKFLATFYTRPASAALLAGLAIRPDTAPGGAAWDDAETLAALQIGDFACGTGTLLSAAYQRLSVMHELNGGEPAALHAPMMRNGLVGLDVLNIAVHLTATMLAGAHPSVTFDGECLLTMPYDKDDASIGSLELLAEHVQPSLISAAAAVTAGGRKPEDVRDLVTRVGHGAFDLVIMNPPFTRSVGQEGEKIGAGNPAFAAFAAPKPVQSEMQKRLTTLAGKDALGTGNAGLASHFVDLGLRKLNANGTLAFVLPLSTAVGEAWARVRQAIEERFGQITVVSVAAASADDCSFSADTGIAEILLLAQQAKTGDTPQQARFISLRVRPQSVVEGCLIAEAIQRAAATVRTLESGPVGSTALILGESVVGEILECDLNTLRAWSLVGIRDLALAQSAYQLTHGSLHLPGMPASERQQLTVSNLGAVANMGPYHADIYWSNPRGEPRGPFELRPINPGDVPTYPILWAHDARAERRLIISPDRQGQVKQWPSDQERVDAKAVAIAATTTRAHYNRDLQFNSQSLIVAMTERKCIGGRAWPSIILHNPEHEYAFSLWCNSTLGLLLHWWLSNKTQAGRGTTTVTAIPNIPTLDTRSLTDEQHAEAKRQFDRLRNERFLPFDQIDEDPARAKLDRAILVDVLDLPESLVAPGGPIDLLRRKLAREPQIHGGKKSRVVFTDDGEQSVKRHDR